MKENGLMIKHMALEFTCIKMDQGMKVNGSTINNMELELKLGKMVLGMKEVMLMDKNKDKEFLYE